MNRREDKAFPFPKDLTISTNKVCLKKTCCINDISIIHITKHIWKGSMSKISIECEEDGYKGIDWIECYSIVEV